jgi:hypothetical protein
LPLQYTNCYYIYNIVSILTKNYVRKFNTHPFLNNMFNNHKQFYGLPFSKLINRFTLQHLVYNKFVWFNATNLLTRLIDYNAALFYFMYIHGTLPLVPRTQGDLLVQVLFGESESVLHQLKHSIHLYNSDRSKLNLILVAALHGQKCNGVDYYQQLLTLHIATNYTLEPSDAEAIMRGEITAQFLESIT